MNYIFSYNSSWKTTWRDQIPHHCCCGLRSLLGSSKRRRQRLFKKFMAFWPLWNIQVTESSSDKFLIHPPMQCLIRPDKLLPTQLAKLDSAPEVPCPFSHFLMHSVRTLDLNGPQEVVPPATKLVRRYFSSSSSWMRTASAPR